MDALFCSCEELDLVLCEAQKGFVTLRHVSPCETTHFLIKTCLANGTSSIRRKIPAGAPTKRASLVDALFVL